VAVLSKMSWVAPGGSGGSLQPLYWGLMSSLKPRWEEHVPNLVNQAWIEGERGQYMRLTRNNKSTCPASHHPCKPTQPHGNQVKLDQFWFTGASQHPIRSLWIKPNGFCYNSWVARCVVWPGRW
jgi:hypothetical protein